MIKFILATMCSVMLLSQFAIAEDYAVVVSQQTSQDPQWAAVVNALVEKHHGVEVFTWEKDVTEITERLRQLHPRFTCVVATPT